MRPSRNPAERGVSIKALMPLVDDKLPMRLYEHRATERAIHLFAVLLGAR